MSLGLIDYAASYFKYKTPTPIRGQPTNKSLKRLKLELQANASSVESDLGRGNHGYLFLVLTNEEYASIPDTEPFVPLTYSGPLVIPATATPIEALELKDRHQEAKRLYLECKNVEKALQRHIQDAVEEKYIEALVNEYTNLLDDDVPTILQYLFYNYGKVRSEEVSQKEHEVMTSPWQPTDPIILLTRPLEQLQKLATQAGIPYTDSQILEKGLTKIRATRDFEYALTLWEDKPEEQKTWANLKTHFHEAQLQLKKIRGPTMQQAGFHHANAIAGELGSQLQTHLEDNNSKLLSVLQQIPGLVETSSSSEESLEEHQQAANSIATNNVQLEILKLLREIRLDLKQDKKEEPTRPVRPRRNRKAPDDKTFPPRSDTSKYCWTHGACNHDGNSCERRAPGHKVDATKENKMEGSKAYCS